MIEMLHALVDAGERERQALAAVAQDDLEVRVAVEEARDHEAERVHRRLGREAPGGACEELVTVVDALLVGWGLTWMQVQRDVEGGELLPKDLVS